MEKVIVIDGKEIKFKSNASTPLRYKAQFRKDFFAEIMKLNKLNTGRKKKDDLSILESMNFDVFYELAWIFAKTADKSIPPLLEWLDEFDEFPIMDIIPEIQDLIVHSIQGKKK